jgi:hypothetical protein
VTDAEIARIAAQLAHQTGWFERLGSPLYERLLERLLEDLHARGPVLDVLAGHQDDRRGTLLPLRLMGAIHRFVLEGRAPDLARHYPSVGGDGDAQRAWTALRALLESERDALRELVKRPVQTNEVGRSAALYCGFAWLAQRTALPLSLREIGASAGLNLRWDRFRFEGKQGRGWGDPSSPVVLSGVFGEAEPPFDVPIEVVDRAGCDPEPLDPTTREGELTLKSYVWTDQGARFRLLDGAIRIAREVPVSLVRSHAIDWLEEELADLDLKAVRVVLHSVVWQYIERDERDRIRRLLEETSLRAPGRVAWLRFEPPKEDTPWFEVKLDLLPDVRDRLVARATPHGAAVEWIG